MKSEGDTTETDTEKDQNYLEPLPEIAVPVTFFKQDPENPNPPVIPIPVCVIQIQIGGMTKINNGTEVAISVRVTQRVGNDGVGRITIRILEKSYVMAGLTGLTPPFFGYPILREDWDIATFPREVTNPDGTTETQIINATDTKVNHNCPRVDAVVFRFPIEAVLDKYVKIRVLATCCDDPLGPPSIMESPEGIFIRSNE